MRVIFLKDRMDHRVNTVHDEPIVVPSLDEIGRVVKRGYPRQRVLLNLRYHSELLSHIVDDGESGFRAEGYA